MPTFLVPIIPLWKPFFQTIYLPTISHSNLLVHQPFLFPSIYTQTFPVPVYSLCSKRKWESFWKLSRRNTLLVFETGLFDDSDNDKQFYGLRAEDIVLQEAVADSDFAANEVSSVHTSDWSKWEQCWLGRKYCNQNGWSRRTRPIKDRFTVRNQNKHIFGRSRCYYVGLLLPAVHTKDVCYNSWVNEPVCLREVRSHIKPTLQEVNNQPCCTQQRDKSTYTPINLVPLYLYINLSSYNLFVHQPFLALGVCWFSSALFSLFSLAESSPPESLCDVPEADTMGWVLVADGLPLTSELWEASCTAVFFPGGSTDFSPDFLEFCVCWNFKY